MLWPPLAPASTVPWRDGALRHAHGPPTSWRVWHESAPLLDEDEGEGEALLEELWLVEAACEALDVLDAGVAACVVAAGVVVVGAACVVVAAATGAGVLEALLEGGAAKAAALNAISAAPATTKRRTDIGDLPGQARQRARIRLLLHAPPRPMTANLQISQFGERRAARAIEQSRAAIQR